MTIAFDAFSNATEGTGALSWAHTPANAPQGVIVFVVQNAGTDEVTGVTYGGAAMTEVTGSPLLKATGEAGAVYGYHLGGGIPTGAQTVVVSVNGTGTTKAAVAITVTACGDTVVQDTDVTISSDAAADPSATLALGGNVCFCAEAFFSGQASVTGITPPAGWTSRYEFDFTSQTAGFYTYDTIGAANVTMGWTQTSDDAMAIGIALTEDALTVAGGFAGEFLGLPGLRGYWPMNAFDSSGNAIDQSGNARTLTYNGNPTYNFHASGGPYIDLDGTGDYLSRADEAGLDIIGTEAYIASAQRGLTLGGWFWPNAVAATQCLMGKFDNTNGPYGLYIQAGGEVLFRVRDAADSANTDVGTTAITGAAWQFVVGRYTPSSEMKNFVNTSTTVNTTSIPASIQNGPDLFYIGGGAAVLTGRVGLCFLCAMALSDTAIDNIYQATRGFYGV
jgi:hypothetical protein